MTTSTTQNSRTLVSYWCQTAHWRWNGEQVGQCPGPSRNSAFTLEAVFTLDVSNRGVRDGGCEWTVDVTVLVAGSPAAGVQEASPVTLAGWSWMINDVRQDGDFLWLGHSLHSSVLRHCWLCDERTSGPCHIQNVVFRNKEDRKKTEWRASYNSAGSPGKWPLKQRWRWSQKTRLNTNKAKVYIMWPLGRTALA